MRCVPWPQSHIHGHNRVKVPFISFQSVLCGRKRVGYGGIVAERARAPPQCQRRKKKELQSYSIRCNAIYAHLFSIYLSLLLLLRLFHLSSHHPSSHHPPISLSIPSLSSLIPPRIVLSFPSSCPDTSLPVSPLVLNCTRKDNVQRRQPPLKVQGPDSYPATSRPGTYQRLGRAQAWLHLCKGRGSQGFHLVQEIHDPARTHPQLSPQRGKLETTSN